MHVTSEKTVISLLYLVHREDGWECCLHCMFTQVSTCEFWRFYVQVHNNITHLLQPVSTVYRSPLSEVGISQIVFQIDKLIFYNRQNIIKYLYLLHRYLYQYRKLFFINLKYFEKRYFSDLKKAKIHGHYLSN